MAARASWSAPVVTVQVFKTTMEACAGVEARGRPCSSNWRSKAAPSAWVARQPKFSTKNPGTLYGNAHHGPFSFYRGLRDNKLGRRRSSSRLEALAAEDGTPLGWAERNGSLLSASRTRGLGLDLGVAVSLS